MSRSLAWKNVALIGSPRTAGQRILSGTTKFSALPREDENEWRTLWRPIRGAWIAHILWRESRTAVCGYAVGDSDRISPDTYVPGCQRCLYIYHQLQLNFEWYYEPGDLSHITNPTGHALDPVGARKVMLFRAKFDIDDAILMEAQRELPFDPPPRWIKIANRKEGGPRKRRVWRDGYQLLFKFDERYDWANRKARHYYRYRCIPEREYCDPEGARRIPEKPPRIRVKATKLYLQPVRPRKKRNDGGSKKYL